MDRISRLIDKASLFAKNAHFDQKRKYSGEPYWNHLQEVAITLLQYGATPAVIAAGYLRDTLEDTKVSYSDLVFAFDRNIAGLVLQVTEVSRPDSGNTPEGKGNRPLRKAVDRQFLAGASWQGQMIKCADMLSNTKDIVAHDLGFARVYVPEKKLLIDELTKTGKVSYPMRRRSLTPARRCSSDEFSSS